MSLPSPSKIVCVGRNYAKHAAELGNTVPERPLIFLKPPSAIIEDGQSIVRPADSSQVEHEGEVGVVIGRRCRTVDEADALGFVAGYRAVNDVTARDLQRSDDQWTRAKGFDTFCPLGPIAPAGDIDPTDLEVTCTVDGELRQRGHTRDLAFSIPFLVSYISRVMTLQPGDIISTGTPDGVSELEEGAEVEVVVLSGGRVLSSVRNPVE